MKTIDKSLKSCKNCAHRCGIGLTFGRCAKAGYYCEIQRKSPSVACDYNFSGWSQRKGIIKRIFAFFW